MKIKILHKLLIFGIILSSMPLILSGIQTINISDRAQKTNILELHANKATETSEIIENHIQNWIQTLLMISYTQDEENLSRQDRLNLLSALVEESEDFVVLRFYDSTLTEENSVTATKQENLQEMVQYPDAYIKLLNAHKEELQKTIFIDEVYISPVISIPELKKNFVTLAVFTQLNEEEGGALVAKVTLDFLQEVIETRSYGERFDDSSELEEYRRIVYIIDESNRLIAHPDKDRALRREKMTRFQATIAEAEANLAQSVFTTEYVNETDENVLGTGVTVKNTNWSIVVETPVKYAYLPVREMKRQLLFWFIVGLIAAIIFSIFLAGLFNRPIKKFVTAAQQVSRGIFTEHVKVETKDELEELAEVFNNMIDQLRLYDEINVNKLISEQNKIEAIIRNIADGVIATDKDNNVLFVNEQSERWFSLKNEQVQNQDLENVISNENLMSLIQKSTQKEDIESIDISINAPLQSSPESTVKKILKATSAPVIDAKNQNIGVVTTLRDITKEKEIDKMKSELMSVVSHELRTPLTSIQGFTQLILEVGEGLSDRVLEFLDIIINESDRLLHIINDFLDLSKIESGRIELTKAPFDLVGSVSNVIFTINSQLSQKNISLTTNFPNKNPIVYADPHLIGQVLVNLVGNAIKYSPPESEVTMSIEQKEDKKYWVSISDTGYGIPQEELDHIFEKFFRVRTESTSEISGTGLGLSIVKEILDQHGEEIYVESEVGKGSTFRFSLTESETDVIPTE